MVSGSTAVTLNFLSLLTPSYPQALLAPTNVKSLLPEELNCIVFMTGRYTGFHIYFPGHSSRAAALLP